jgi:2-keto-3-deoxy-L-rhamnonate aldolase RhmA
MGHSPAAVSEIATGPKFDWIVIDAAWTVVGPKVLALRATARSETIALVRLPGQLGTH